MTELVDTAGPCRLEVWDDENATKLADLPYTGTAQVDDVLNEVGLLTCEVGAEEAAAEHLVDGNHVRAYIGDVCIFAGLIEDGVETVEVDDLPANQVVRLSLRGHIAAWSYVPVRPAGGLDAKPQSLDRPHKWSSPETDISGWDDAEVLYESLSEPWDDPQTDPPWFVPWVPPVRFLDPTAKWISSRPFNGVDAHPAGTSLIATDITIPDDGLYELQVAVDDGFDLDVDGITIMSGANSPADSFIKASVATLELTAGVHRFALAIHNYERPETPQVGTFGGPNVLRAAFALYSRVAGGANQLLTADDLVAHSDETWKSLDFPENWPAPTDGAIVATHLSEAQDDGALDGVTLNFTAPTPTGGGTWDANGAFSLQVDDDTLLSTIQAQANAGRMDWWYDPEGRELSAWNHGGKGAPHAAAYVVAGGLHGLTGTTQPIINSLQVRWKSGRFLLEDSASIAANGLRRKPLKLADLSEADARSQAQRILDANSTPTSARSVAIELGPDDIGTSLAPYGAGGPRTGDSPTFNGERLRIVRITTTFTELQWPTFTLEVETRQQQTRERQEIALSRVSAGTLGGRSRVATPAAGMNQGIVAGQARAGQQIAFTQVQLTPEGYEDIFDVSPTRTWEETQVIQRLKFKQEVPPQDVATIVELHRVGPGGDDTIGTVTLPVGSYRTEVVQGMADLAAYTYVTGDLEGIYAKWVQHDTPVDTGDPVADAISNARWGRLEVVATPANPATVDAPAVDVPW